MIENERDVPTLIDGHITHILSHGRGEYFRGKKRPKSEKLEPIQQIRVAQIHFANKLQAI